MTLRHGWLLLPPLLLAACGSQPPRPTIERPAVSSPSLAPQAAGKPLASPPAVVQKRGGGYYQDDGPGDNPPSPEFLAAIPDAEPKAEPLHRYANKPYTVLGQTYLPMTTLKPYQARGVGSWYGRKFQGQKTSSGEIYDMYGMSAAHPTLPIPSYARVTNLSNGKSVVVRINDRGPFHSGRLIDLSYAAAWKLGYIGNGSTMLEVDSILPGTMLAAKQTPQTPQTPAKPAEADAAPDPIEQLVQRAETPVTIPAIPEIRESHGVFLQLGAFSNHDNAESLRFRLSRDLSGLPDAAELNGKLAVQARGGVYRVQLGPWRDHAQAQHTAERLREAFEMQSVVVHQ
ncbi:MAG: septal ring lytic transglycosylase RlpA family protein [Betaproteobacteria bacterium]|nr:septal ring lytic transglycosylase RlpA family protein [Betaproteobacteria bacterium]